MGQRKSRTKTISSLLIWLDRCNIISNSTIVFIVNLLLILHHSISTAYNDCLSTDRCHISYGEAAHGPWPIVYQSAHVTWLDIQRENLAIYADLLSCRRLKKLAVSLISLFFLKASCRERACVVFFAFPFPMSSQLPSIIPPSLRLVAWHFYFLKVFIDNTASDIKLPQQLEPDAFTISRRAQCLRITDDQC